MDFNGPSLNLLGFNLDRFLALMISVLSFTNDHILVCAFGTQYTLTHNSAYL